MVISFAPTDPLLVGVTVQYNFALFNTHAETEQKANGKDIDLTFLQVTITACELTSITATSTIADVTKEVYVDTLDEDIAVPSLTESPACGYAFTYTATI